jgi:hypothetical protein
VTVPLISSTKVGLAPSHLFASDIFQIVDGATFFDRTQWTFNADTQVITLKPGFSFVGPLVEVAFAPGVPVTTTYLLNQPLLNSVTALGFGTPPFPKSRMADASLSPTSPSMALDDVPLFVDDPETLYEGMEFMEITNGGWERLLAIAGEGDRKAALGLWKTIEGDAVYSFTGTGAALPNASAPYAGLKQSGIFAGLAASPFVFDLRGPAYWEGYTPVVEAGMKLILDGVLTFAAGGMAGGAFAGPVITNATSFWLPNVIPVPLPIPISGFALLESGDQLLLEDGGELLI